MPAPPVGHDCSADATAPSAQAPTGWPPLHATLLWSSGLDEFQARPLKFCIQPWGGPRAAGLGRTGGWEELRGRAGGGGGVRAPTDKSNNLKSNLATSPKSLNRGVGGFRKAGQSLKNCKS